MKKLPKGVENDPPMMILSHAETTMWDLQWYHGAEWSISTMEQLQWNMDAYILKL